MFINFWYAAELSANLTTKPVKARMLGQNFVLFRDAAGKAHCLSNVCLHRCGSLADGWITSGRVVCPYHGWEFNGAGQCERIPSLGPGQPPMTARARVDSYPVQEKYGIVFAFLGDLPDRERPPIMDIAEWVQPGWRCTTLTFSLKANFARVGIMNTRESFLIQTEDAAVVAKNCPTLLSTFQAGFRSLLSVPLISSDEVIGALHFRSAKPKAYTPNEVRLAEGVAAQIAGAIAVARLLSQRRIAELALQRSEEEARRLAQENATMAEIGRIICSTLDIESVYERFSETVRKLIHFDRMAINIIKPDSRTFSIPYVSGAEVPGRRANDSVPLAGTAAEEVIQTRSSLLMRKDDRGEFATRFPGLLPVINGGMQSLLMVPLVSQDRAIGVLNIQSAHEPSYTKEDLRLAEKVGAQIAGAIASSQIFAKHQQVLKAFQESEEKYCEIVPRRMFFKMRSTFPKFTRGYIKHLPVISEKGRVVFFPIKMVEFFGGEFIFLLKKRLSFLLFYFKSTN